MCSLKMLRTVKTAKKSADFKKSNICLTFLPLNLTTRERTLPFARANSGRLVAEILLPRCTNTKRIGGVREARPNKNSSHLEPLFSSTITRERLEQRAVVMS
jgi:hypothetical protein